MQEFLGPSIISITGMPVLVQKGGVKRNQNQRGLSSFASKPAKLTSLNDEEGVSVVHETSLSQFTRLDNSKLPVMVCRFAH